LAGVGPYIAAAVISISHNIPIATVDGNVMRVYTRFTGLTEDIRKNGVRDRIAQELQPLIPARAAGDFTQAMMELGALVCTPRLPNCKTCPFNPSCFAFLNDKIAQLPVKSPLKKAETYNVSIAVILDKRKLYIQRRHTNGHLGGLWEFPGGKSEPGEQPEQTLLRECREELGTDVEILSTLAIVDHAYTHFKIHMTVFICHLKNGMFPPLSDRESCWIDPSQLEQYPFPGANHKFFPRLKQYLERLEKEKG